MDGFIILRAESSGQSFPACAYVRTWAAVSYQKTLDKWKKKVYNNSTIDKAICFSVRKSAVGNRPPRFAFLCVYAKGNTAEFDCSTVFLLEKWVLIVVKNVDISTLKFWGSFAQYSRNPFIFKGFRGIVVRFNSCRPHQTNEHPLVGAFLFGMTPTIRQELRGEPRTRVSVLPTGLPIRDRWRAKWTIDNCPAGRAAKGAIPVDRTTK